MSALFTPLTIRSVTIRNRIALSPMCMYSCENCDGVANSWHLVHLGTRASGGAGIVMTEAVAVTPRGRISPQDLGIWNDEQTAALQPVTSFISSQGATPAIQLAHAGRKAGTYRPWSEVRGSVLTDEGGWADQEAPSAIAFKEGMRTPHEMSVEDINELIRGFKNAAERSLKAGFEIVELHVAHGYLLHQFLSPISNKRTDNYGGSFENRTRLQRELVESVREVWPDNLPLFVRISATDWVDGGWTIEDSVALAKMLKPLGVDLFDCSSGGSTPDAEIPAGPGFQVPFATRIKEETEMLTGAVGMITEPKQAEEIIKNDQADLVFLGRKLLSNPYWPQMAARELKAEQDWPVQYGWAVKPR